MRADRGFSLLEVLMAGAVALIVLGIAALVLGPAGRTWLRGQRRSDAQQAVLIVTRRVREELRGATKEGLRIEGNALDFVLADGTPAHHDLLVLWSCKGVDGQALFDGSGNRLWPEKMAFYLDSASGEVRLARSFVESPAVEARADELAAWAPESWLPQLPADQLQVLARHVRSLAFWRADQGLIRIRVDAREEEEEATLVGSGTTQ